MSSGKSIKRSHTKSVLATLERLSGSSTPDKDQTRYLCHKLLQLVNDQQGAKKDAGSNAGLDIILLTLESCNDQATCAALVGTLTEISRGGSTAMKRLIAHDATRVLLHILAYMGAELDWRLISAIMQLLAKLGPKDRRLALRARLTGSLPIILNTVRSSSTHSNQAKLLPFALSVLKLCLTSTTNANLLGRAGAVHVLYRIVVSLSRKQVVPLKNAFATLNLLVRFSKANAGRAVKLGVVSHLIKMHQDYHKHDFKHEKNCAIRKSILNVIKNMASLKAGRKAFTDGNGLMVLYRSCQDYLGVDYNDRMAESFLTVAIIIIRRCQVKSKLPVTNLRCSFQFSLPGIRDRSDSTESNNILDSDDDFDYNDSNDEFEDNKETNTKRRGSGTSVSKESATSDGYREYRPKPVSRSTEELKMYDNFFPELTDFQFPAGSWWHRTRTARPHTSGEVESVTMAARNRTMLYSLPEIDPIKPVQTGFGRWKPESRHRDLSSTSSNSLVDKFNFLKVGSIFDRDPGNASDLNMGRNPHSAPVRRTPDFNQGSGEDNGHRHLQSKLQNGSSSDDTDISFLIDCLAAFEEGHFSGVNRTEIASLRKQAAESIQKVATSTKSTKQDVNKLSEADAWGSVANENSEKQANKKNVQKLIRAKVLEDLARTLFPVNVINRLVYSSDNKVHEKKEFPVVENGQVFKCEVFAPSEPFLKNDSSLTESSCPSLGHELSRSPSLSSALPTERVVINLPSQDVDSNSTSVSDDTWPGAYMDKQKADFVDFTNNPPTTTSDRHSASSTSSRGEDPETQNTLKFDSQFESGNLRAAFQIREFEYDLVLNPDCNSNHHFQWYYFQVTNMKHGRPYRFNIINCEKKGSVVNEGMQPVMYSMTEAKLGRAQWFRIGRETCYYRNHFLRNFSSAGGSKRVTFFTLTFTVTFQHDDDTCYFAYHYPYTYTKLQVDLQQFMDKIDPSEMYVRKQTFCETLSGNPVPLLTITAPPDNSGSTTNSEAVEELVSRPYIFLTARVHPGESNASWTMRGTLKLLLTPSPSSSDDVTNPFASVADELRRKYIFKVVPMLNPDGVINGHHRCSLTGEDLNRTWSEPNAILFPTIYHTKGLLQYLHSIKKAPLLYCDYHGHSRKMNVFLYGCSHRDSIAAGETGSISEGPADLGYKTLPKLLDRFAAPFSLKSCNFVVEKSKLSTARVVVWKEFSVTRSYTMESTYCGCDQGSLRGKQINTKELENMGSKFCEVLLHLNDREISKEFPICEAEDEQNVNQFNSTSKGSDDEDTQRSPGCPVNSDAELTPDEDIWNLDESYGALPSANENENNSSFRVMLEEQRQSSEMVDMSFWRYEMDEITVDYHQPIVVSDASDVSDRSTATMGESSADNYISSTDAESRNPTSHVTSGRISQATGRVRDFNESDDIATTAPRPFESGLILRKARSPRTSPTLPSTSGSKNEAKNFRAKRKPYKPWKN